MSDRRDRIAARLQERGAETLAIFTALEPGEWDSPVYPADDAGAPLWTARDMLCHFISAERSFLRLFEDVLAGGSGAPEDFDIDRFNRSQVAKMADIPIEELLEQFAAIRGEVIAFVRALDEADLDREGRHPFFGIVSLEKALKLIYRHNGLHERDMRRALGEDAS
ncbi:MAG: hypothetical protein Kow00124_20370 [Anaerolineae bacterium]